MLFQVIAFMSNLFKITIINTKLVNTEVAIK